MSAPHSTNRRNVLAISLSMLLFSGTDVLIRLAMEAGIPVTQVIFVRGVFTVVILIVPLIASGQWRLLAVGREPLVLLRTGFDVLHLAFFVIALPYMVLADLYAAYSTLPIWMTLFSVLLLGEKVGWRRWSAVAVGFIGMLFVIKPTPETFNFWALFALAAATTSVFRDITTRWLDPNIPSLVLTFLSVLGMTLTAGAVGFAEVWQPIGWTILATLGIAGILQVTAIYLLVFGLREGDMSVTAPFRYTVLLWGTLAGYLVFNQIPDPWSFIGIVLIAASGIYTFHRDALRRTSKVEVASPPSVP